MTYRNYYYTRDLTFVSGPEFDSESHAFDDLYERLTGEPVIGAVIIEVEAGNSPKVFYKEGVLPVGLRLAPEVPEFHPLLNYAEQER